MKKHDNAIIGIYKITNPENISYIGKTKDIYDRWGKYKNLNCKSQPSLYNSLKKYGPENHTFEIIEECLLEQLNEQEIYWIDFYKSYDLGLNLNLGGGGILSQSELAKDKISKAHKGRISPLRGRTRSYKGRISPMKGKQRTKESCAQQSKTLTGKRTNGDKVINVITNQIWISKSQCAESYGVSVTTINNWLKRKNKNLEIQN
jgi:hypothetical protein